MIQAEHFEYWGTYVATDTECAFFTGPNNFIEGYYTADDGSVRFVTEAITGSVVSLQVENCVIQYDHSKLLVETPLYFSEELTELKQAWSRVDRDHLQEDIRELLQRYLQLEEP